VSGIDREDIDSWDGDDIGNAIMDEYFDVSGVEA